MKLGFVIHVCWQGFPERFLRCNEPHHNDIDWNVTANEAIESA